MDCGDATMASYNHNMACGGDTALQVEMRCSHGATVSGHSCINLVHSRRRSIPRSRHLGQVNVVNNHIASVRSSITMARVMI